MHDLTFHRGGAREQSHFVLRALLVFAVLALGCGEEETDDAAVSSPDAGLDASLGRPISYETTLVPITSNDASVFISVPHAVSLLDVNGNPLVPPVETMSGLDGRIRLDVPQAGVSIYVVGVGSPEDDSSTYDTISLNHDFSSMNSLLRIATRETDRIATEGAGYEQRDDRAALAGRIFWTTSGERRGVVACAKVYIDGALAPDEDQTQRYVGNTLELKPLSEQPETGAFGFFVFGNVKVGLHTLRVSLDDGKNFSGLTQFTVGRPRRAAQSPIKAVSYQVDIELEASEDPTPAGCAAASGR
ncbi:MAG TPA: hypothetical protein VFX59_11225 [Polyangiales bacterium]|nr:hypothetical protein [Polyangiales bacterium]